jgi:chromosome segregation ATPase
MKNYMDDATVAIKQKRQDIAAGKQQFAMTSMNNLALLLSDVLKQMQDQQQQQQQSAGSKGKKKKKPKPGQGPSMSQLQKQLNQQIQQLQQGQKSGRQLSEQLAQMAAQQEALRKALAELEKQQTNKEKGNKGNGSLSQLKDLMEKTEQDLVNKRLTPEVIRRQGDILTRLLEAENAMREREQDPKRESKTAQDILRNLPPSFSQYLKQKEQQVELLKTLPPNLTPFYKQETTRYFQNLSK